MLITRITLRVITGYITLDYIIIIRKLIFVNQWSERREHFRSAITGSVKNAKVYTVNNGRASEKEVTVGSMAGNNVEIISGLQAGDSIVVSGLINVSDGVMVKNKTDR